MSIPRAVAVALLATLTSCGQPAAPEAPASPAPAATASSPTAAATAAPGLPGKLARQAVPEQVPGSEERVVRAVLWGTESVSEAVARDVFLDATHDLLIREQFARLEQLEERCLSETSSFGDLTPWRSLFYEAFDSPVHGSSGRTWEELEERTRRWAEASPDRLAPHLARARAALGAARAEKEPNRRKSLLAVARQEAASARELAPDDPEVWRVEIDLAGPGADAARLFEAALHRHSHYAPLYRTRMAQLPPGDLKGRARFITESADRSKEVLGDSLYALLPEADAARVQRMFQENLLAWPRMHQGFLDLLQRQPLSVPLHNRFCFMAAQAGEVAVAEALFRRLGEQWDPAVWTNREYFEEIRSWNAAEAGKLPASSPTPVEPLQATLLPPGPEKSFLAPDADARLMAHQLADLWQRERYADLEAIAATLRRQKVRLPWGDCALAEFYASLSDFHSLTEEEWSGVLAAFDRWQKAFPDSPTPRVARARTLTAHAWDARGSDTADTVADKDWKIFQERLARARKALEFPEGMEDDPHRHTELSWIAMAEGAQDDESLGEFEKALSMDAGCSHAYWNRAVALLPRWGGEPGDLGRLAAAVSKEQGPGAAAFVGWGAVDYAGAEPFEKDGLEFAPVQAGFEALLQQFGKSATLRNRAAYVACVAGDRAAAHQALEALDEDWDPLLWSSAAHLARWKEWAASKEGAAPSEQAWARILDRGVFEGHPPHLVRSTDQVPARAGAQFGMRVQYEAWPAERSVKLRVQVDPPTGEPVKEESVVAAGKTPPPLLVYPLPAAPAAGTWKMSLYLEDIRVVQQAFEVAAPAAPPSPVRGSAAPPPSPAASPSSRPPAPPLPGGG